jgi:hypothetical protein
VTPVDAPPAAEAEPDKELLRDQARLRVLLNVAFDFAWEMTLEGADDLRVHLLQDRTTDLGLPSGEFRRTFTAREWIERMEREEGHPIDRILQWRLRLREVYQSEYRMRCADGGYTCGKSGERRLSS